MPDMYGLGMKTFREEENRFQRPSFSSTLLDKIYRSIDEAERKSETEMNFYRETMAKKQSTAAHGNCNVFGSHRRQKPTEVDRKSRHNDHDHDQNALFFSCTSSSSDSSYGGFSSSDTESMYGVRTQTSGFALPRPKPVRTTLPLKSENSEKSEKRQSALFYEHREVHYFDDYHHHTSSNGRFENPEENLIKSKSRALKIYNNLKKVKQPISPGGKLTNFLNSLFTTGNTKKTRAKSPISGYEEVNTERKFKSAQASTCSSASSFSRSCLSKNSPSLREKLRSRDKRTVHFCPESLIVSEDSPMAVQVPTTRKVRRSPTEKKEEELKFPVMEKSRRAEEAAREFLKKYRQSQEKSNLILGDFPMKGNEDEEDDDAESCSSSDLFELDHLAMMVNGRYCEELPVYETTHVGNNRAIANGLTK